MDAIPRILMLKIENIHLIEEVFGRFPSFHDAEVLQIVLRRESIGTLPTLEAQIHVFEMTSQIKNGRYVLKHHSLVTFQFLEIDGLNLDGFNHQNVLQGLSIKDISDYQLENLKFEVGFDGIFGVDARFKCRSVKIVSVAPFLN
jgi:hypothetical protein